MFNLIDLPFRVVRMIYLDLLVNHLRVNGWSYDFDRVSFAYSQFIFDGIILIFVIFTYLRFESFTKIFISKECGTLWLQKNFIFNEFFFEGLQFLSDAITNFILTLMYFLKNNLETIKYRLNFEEK